MRQETGSNQSQAAISISVRLMSGGDHCLIDNLLPNKLESKECYLKVELLTKRALLTPKSQYDRSSAREELASFGIIVGIDEEVITIESRDLIALIVVPNKIVARLDEQYAGRYEFTTPLLRRPISSEAHAILDVSHNLATIKIYDKGWQLRFIDTYDATSTASVVYWCQCLSKILGLKSHILYIYRYECKLDRLLSKNFKTIMYANNKRSI